MNGPIGVASDRAVRLQLRCDLIDVVAVADDERTALLRYRGDVRPVWWVNQGKTDTPARDGGFVWAPPEGQGGSTPALNVRDGWRGMGWEGLGLVGSGVGCIYAVVGWILNFM